MQNFSANVIKSNSFPYQAMLNQFSKRMGRAQSALSKLKKGPAVFREAAVTSVSGGMRNSSVIMRCTAVCAPSWVENSSKDCFVSFRRAAEMKMWFHWTKMIVKVQQKENKVYWGVDGRDESLALLKIHKQFYFLNEYDSVCFGWLSSCSYQSVTSIH